MKSYTILGIDPGLANTGLGVVAFEKHDYVVFTFC
jgi:Holliday junction resolvasome RuvABC endonuclease subunit